MYLWPHQTLGLEKIDEAHSEGCRRVCVTSPTGGGKTRIMLELALRFLGEGLRVALYTNRRALIDQLSDVCLKEGVYHGIRAAGYADEREHRFQICSIQTEYGRSIRSAKRDLHHANLVLVDEAHLHAADMAVAVLSRHRDAGAFIVGFTATPIGLSGAYERLVQAGTVSELRACGALVPAVHYAPDEPDLRRVMGIKEGQDLSQALQRSVMCRGGKEKLFGRIWDNFNKINPDHKPTICFGPGVDESKWIAEEFTKSGVRAAHLDGEKIWIDGEEHKTTTELRREILEESKKGSIGVLSNRFVLREGIDAPWLSHGILACVFGSLQSYLQSGGRLLRRYSGFSSVTIQDHGGNWWRHGSLNEDREWELVDTDEKISRDRSGKLRASPEREPFRCPRCNRVWASGTRCNPAQGGCGHQLPEFKKRSRIVVTEEGVLKLVEGRIFHERKEYKLPDGPEKWKRMYYRARQKSWNASWRQAMGQFFMENGSWPSKEWAFMPLNEGDFDRKVGDVHETKLRKP